VKTRYLPSSKAARTNLGTDIMHGILEAQQSKSTVSTFYETTRINTLGLIFMLRLALMIRVVVQRTHR